MCVFVCVCALCYIASLNNISSLYIYVCVCGRVLNINDYDDCVHMHMHAYVRSICLRVFTRLYN